MSHRPRNMILKPPQNRTLQIISNVEQQTCILWYILPCLVVCVLTWNWRHAAQCHLKQIQNASKYWLSVINFQSIEFHVSYFCFSLGCCRLDDNNPSWAAWVVVLHCCGNAKHFVYYYAFVHIARSRVWKSWPFLGSWCFSGHLCQSEWSSSRKWLLWH